MKVLKFVLIGLVTLIAVLWPKANPECGCGHARRPAGNSRVCYPRPMLPRWVETVTWRARRAVP